MTLQHKDNPKSLKRYVLCAGCGACGPLKYGIDVANAAWSARVETHREQALEALAIALTRDNMAERARLRRWQLRLRWRHRPKRWRALADRLHYRMEFPSGSGAHGWTVPIAGPRGVLP